MRLIPVCPEFSSGLGAPRDPLRLVRPLTGGVRLLNAQTGRDDEVVLPFLERNTRLLPVVTEPLAFNSGDADVKLDGFVGQGGSPLCGVRDARMYPDGSPGKPFDRVDGLFAERLRSRGIPTLSLRSVKDVNTVESFLCASFKL